MGSRKYIIHLKLYLYFDRRKTIFELLINYKNRGKGHTKSRMTWMSTSSVESLNYVFIDLYVSRNRYVFMFR